MIRWTLLACLTMLGIVPAAARPIAPPCARHLFEGDAFLVCSYHAGTDELRLVQRDAGGKPGSLAELQRGLGGDAARVRFAMNAGMYDPRRRPLGLFVADGKEEQPLNRNTGEGNFFLQPNGVFWVDRAGEPHVDETAAYAARGAHPRWATQSGPLLLAAGTLHPTIAADGPSRHVRNAVGIRGREALFVISEKAVSFGRLARFLRDGLGCADALYLDGTVSSLWAPALRRQDRRTDLGTFLVVLSAGAH